MKYIISESQYKTLLEQNVPNSIKRRANEKTLVKYILLSQRNNPPYCQEHEDGYDYADAVIDDAIDYFLTEVGPEIEEINEYGDILEYLRMMCRNLFGESLVYHYENNCIPDES
jgi:hypothetical protein